MNRVTEARYVAGHTLWLRFSDGLEGDVDLASELDGEVFEPLQDPEAFRSSTLSSPPTATWHLSITWPTSRLP